MAFVELLNMLFTNDKNNKSTWYKTLILSPIYKTFCFRNNPSNRLFQVEHS